MIVSRRRRLLAIVVVSAALQLAVGSYIYSGQPAYLSDYRVSDNPDAIDYVRLGENFWSRGEYSRQTGPPYVADLLRTPVYPLVAGGVQALFGVIWPLYALQALLVILTAVLVSEIASSVFGAGAALAAGLVVAVDPGLVMLAYEPMSEVIFITLFTAALWQWARAITAGHRIRYVWIGLLLGLAILTRPAALYAPVALAIGSVIGSRNFRRPIIASACGLAIVAYLTVAPWILRNYTVHSIARLTNADTVNLLYFAGAGVYQLRNGGSREEAEATITRDYRLPSLAHTNNIWLAGAPAHEVDERQRRAAREILTAHPASLAQATTIGLAKSAIAHTANELAAVAGQTWSAPGLDRLLRLEFKAAWSDLSRNDSFLIGLWLWQVGLAVATLLLACGGIAVALKRMPPPVAVSGLLAVGAYLILTIGIVGMDAYARHRAPLLPLAAIFAGAALSIRRVRSLADEGITPATKVSDSSDFWRPSGEFLEPYRR